MRTSLLRVSHIEGQRCDRCDAPPRAPWSDRFTPVEYADESLRDHEDDVVRVLVRVAGSTHATILEVCRALRIGPGPASSLDEGDPRETSERSKDTYAWAAIRELIQIGVFTTHDDVTDEQLWRSELGSSWQRDYEGKYKIQVRRGELIERWAGPPAYDSAFWTELRDALLARRPTRQMVEAFAAFHDHERRVDDALAALSAAGQADLVRYLRSGAQEHPDAWSLTNEARLGAVSWEFLAAALAEAGVPQRNFPVGTVRNF